MVFAISPNTYILVRVFTLCAVELSSSKLLYKDILLEAKEFKMFPLDVSLVFPASPPPILLLSLG